MASTQLIKTSTKNAINVCTTILSQKQSQEVIQTMILGAFSSLAFLRRLLPDKAFDETCIPLKDELFSYDDFAHGRLGSQRKSSKGQFPRMKIPLLRYGLSKRANTFLDNLAAAFQVLEVGNLRAIHFHVHADSTDRGKIIETYKLSIRYDDNSDNGKQMATIHLEAGGNVLLDAEATNKQLAKFLRKVVDLCDKLPDLPEHRHVSLSIEAVEGFTENALPPGYEPSAIQNLLLAQAEGFTRESTSIHGVSIGFHSGVLEVLHLIKAGADGQIRLPPELAQRRLPNTLTYETDAHELEVEISNTAKPNEVIQATNDALAPIASSNAQRTSADKLSTLAGGNHTSGDKYAPRAMQHPSILSTAIAPQRSSSVTFGRGTSPMTKALAAINQPEYLTQGDTQPQSQVYPHSPGDDTTEVSNEEINTSVVPPRKKLVIVLKVAKQLSNNTPAMRTSVKKSRMLHLLSRKGTGQRASRISMHSKGERPRNDDIVRCDCGYQEDEGAMAVCEICGFWQHLHCYGYKRENDPRMPANHVCYRCLLTDLEDQTLSQLQCLALQRRCVHHVLEHGIKSKAELTAVMGLEPDIADQQFDWLRTHGLVPHESKPQRRGRSKAAAAAVHGGPAKEKMLEELFNPFRYIAHHFDFPATEAIKGVTRAPKPYAQLRSSMPPPVTPACASRKAAPTPGSDLDHRDQTVVRQTPCLPRSRTRTSLKHRLQDVDQEVASPPKRRKGSAPVPSEHKILQSKVIFNSTAADSSPYGP